MTAPASDSRVTQQPSTFAALNAVRTALDQPQTEPAALQRQQAAEKPGDFAIAMRLAGEALATATRAAETELRKTQELLERAEVRARRAEERAQLAEKRVAEWEKTFCEIRDNILGKLPPQQLAA
jgi:hypothetical protein